MPTARTASSNSTCLLPEPNRSQTVLLFLHTPQASPAVPSKEPEQEGWAGKQAGRKGRDEESRGGPGEGGGAGQGGGGIGGPKNTKKQQKKVRGSRRQRPIKGTRAGEQEKPGEGEGQGQGVGRARSCIWQDTVLKLRVATARTDSSNVTCLLPEPSWSQTVLLFLHTPQASPAVPSKEPEQERWAGKQEQRVGRK